jgi:hypothetical protein
MNVFSRFEEEEDQEKKKRNWGIVLLEKSNVQLCLLFVTFYALFADDYKILTAEKNMDLAYDVFGLIAISVFVAEILIACFYKTGYFNSYYFYLDFVSTASMVLDLSWIKILLIQYGYPASNY